MPLFAEKPLKRSCANKEARTRAKSKVTLVKSTIGEVISVKETVRALGLNKIRSSKELEDTPAVRGMIKKVHHLVKAENI